MHTVLIMLWGIWGKETNDLVLEKWFRNVEILCFLVFYQVIFHWANKSMSTL